MTVRMSCLALTQAHAHAHGHHKYKYNPHHPTPISSTSKTKRVFMLSATQNPSSHIKLQKVYEDKSSGIVCYRDDKGEITCEGYDEGPRLHHQHHCHCTFSSYQRPTDEEAIVRLLKSTLLLVVDAAGNSSQLPP